MSDTRVCTLPTWAAGLKNLRGLIKFSRSHIYTIVGMKGPGGTAVVGKAVMDTGGSHSLIDKDTAEQFSLKVCVGDTGYFWGPGNTIEAYYGKIERPVVLQFDREVCMQLPELKVVNGMCKDPLFIIGTGMMAPEHPGFWYFLNVGFHPRDRRGVMTFMDGNGMECGVDLASWPYQASRWVHV